MIDEVWYEGTTPIRQTSYTYDAVGNQLTASDPDSRLTYTYDVLNRVTSVDNQGTPAVPRVVLTYQYDAEGNQTLVRDSFGVEVRATYDGRHRLISQTWTGGGIDDARIEFDYNARGDQIEIRRFADAVGAVRSGRSTFDYVASGRVVDIRHRDAVDQVLADYDYAYDLLDRLISESHHGNSTAYTYDLTDQLLGADHSLLPDEFYTYDANGNRTSSSVNGPNIQTGPDNRLPSDGTFRYEYDNEGNLIRKTEIAPGNATQFTYDHRNRLTRVVETSAGGVILSETQYVYDTMNCRITKSVNGVKTHFVYNGDNPWADFNGAGEVIARYLYGRGMDKILARFRPGEGTSWYLVDRLGTVRDIADAAGNLASHFDYDSFGQIITQTNPIASDRFTFTGRELVAEINLYYYRARWYDPAIGRFVSRDRVGGHTEDLNLYRYVRNSVPNATDPTGQLAASEYALLLSVSAAILSGALYEVTSTDCPGVSDAGDALVGAVIGGPKGLVLWGIALVAFVLSVELATVGPGPQVAIVVGAFAASGFADFAFDMAKNDACALAAEMGL